MRPILTHHINANNKRISVLAIGASSDSAPTFYGIDIPGPVTSPGQLAYEGLVHARTAHLPDHDAVSMPPWTSLTPAERKQWNHAGASVQVHCAKHPTIAFDANIQGGISEESVLAVLIDRLDRLAAQPEAHPAIALAHSSLRTALDELAKAHADPKEETVSPV